MIKFDADLLEPNILASDGEVDPAHLALIIAYSTAVSLKRLADAAEKGTVPVLVDGGPAMPKVTITRGGTAPAKPVTPAAPAKPIPAGFTEWGGKPTTTGEASGIKLVGPVDGLADVIVWYRKGKSSNKLSAGQVNWSHTGGPDDVLAYRVVGNFADRVTAGGGDGDA